MIAITSERSNGILGCLSRFFLGPRLGEITMSLPTQMAEQVRGDLFIPSFPTTRHKEPIDLTLVNVPEVLKRSKIFIVSARAEFESVKRLARQLGNQETIEGITVQPSSEVFGISPPLRGADAAEGIEFLKQINFQPGAPFALSFLKDVYTVPSLLEKMKSKDVSHLLVFVTSPETLENEQRVIELDSDLQALYPESNVCFFGGSITDHCFMSLLAHPQLVALAGLEVQFCVDSSISTITRTEVPSIL